MTTTSARPRYSTDEIREMLAEAALRAPARAVSVSILTHACFGCGASWPCPRERSDGRCLAGTAAEFACERCARRPRACRKPTRLLEAIQGP